MTVGQLRYSWAERGPEGNNRYQIVAATGTLRDSHHPLTAAVLRSCYAPERETLTWEEHGAARIVVLRTPRASTHAQGNLTFSAHALVGTAASLPSSVLPRLVGASGWAAHEPDPATPDLSVLASLDEFGLGVHRTVPGDHAGRALATFILNLSQGNASYLELPIADAAAVAGAINDLLPDRYGIASFCSNAQDSEVDRYQLVCGRPPAGRFAPLIHDQPLPAIVVEAVQILRRARSNEPAARRVMDAIEEVSENLQSFAIALATWVAIERRQVSVGMLARTSALARRSPALLEEVVEVHDAWILAEGIAKRDPGWQAVLAAMPEGKPRRSVGGAIEHRLAQLPPADALQSLVALGGRSARTASQLTRHLAETWAGPGYELTPLQRFEAMRLVGAGSDQPGRVTDLLLDAPTAALVVESDLASPWKVRAVLGFHRALPPDALADAMVNDANVAIAMRGALPDRGDLVSSLGGALGVMKPALALDFAEWFGSSLQADALDALRWAAVTRSRAKPRETIDLALRVVRAQHRTDDRWIGLLVSATEHHLRQERSTADLALIKRVAEEIRTSPTLTVIEQRWCVAILSLYNLSLMVPSSRDVDELGIALAGLGSEPRDAALALVVREFRLNSEHFGRWSDKLAMLRSCPAWTDSSWELVVEAALSEPPMPQMDDGRRVGRVWTAIWLGYGAAQGWLPKHVFSTSAATRFREGTTEGEREQIAQWCKTARDRKAGKAVRKWLHRQPGVAR